LVNGRTMWSRSADQGRPRDAVEELEPVSWDHDHCDFCGAKFMAEKRLPDVLLAGYTEADAPTGESAVWVCAGCFSDFKDRFGWTVVEVEDEAG
jgi:hypothetical protein